MSFKLSLLTCLLAYLLT